MDRSRSRSIALGVKDQTGLDFQTLISATENGWTDGSLALDWIQKDFESQMREKAAGETRVLIMDGHSSHYTADLLVLFSKQY